MDLARRQALAWRVIDMSQRLPHGRYIRVHAHYSEPGYTAPDTNMIAVCDWNPESFSKDASKADRTMSRISDTLERLGVDMEWEDEWLACDKCDGLVRCQPDSYGWSRSYMFDDCDDCICATCLREDIDYALELAENEDGLVSAHVLPNLEDYGYVRRYFLEYGLHDGQAYKPTRVKTWLRDLGVERSILKLADPSQFSVGYEVWVGESDKELVQAADIEECLQRPSPAEAMRRGLQAISALPHTQASGVVTLHSITETGDVVTRTVTNAEFIKGVKA